MNDLGIKNRLNIFVDETGEFGFGKRAAKFYGVALVFHEQNTDISPQVKLLKHKLKELDFGNKMIHMGDLVMGHGDFEGMTIEERHRIYTYLYKFAKEVDAKYLTVIIDKKDAKDSAALSRAIRKELNRIIEDNLAYFQSFNRVALYYDGGQAPLNKVLNETLGALGGFEQEKNFDKVEKKLFQVADMFTYIDKIRYKYKCGIKFTKTEQAFFAEKRVKNIEHDFKKHRL